MSDWCNSDTGEAVYRSLDAIKNLRIRVSLERVTTTASLSQQLQQQVLSQQDGGVLELVPLSSQPQLGDAEEVVTVGWQEKLFSQYEMELFQNEMACQSPLDRQYHKEVMALTKAKGRQNCRIFTYTDYDRYSCPVQQLTQGNDLLSTTRSKPTFLAERMATLRHRRQDRRTMDSSFPKSKIINWEPSDEFKKNSHEVNSVMQVMHIMGDLGPSGGLGQKQNEFMLFTVKTDGNGTVIVKPDFNKGKEPYRIATTGTIKEIWHLTIENVSSTMKSEEKDREEHLYKDLYVRNKEFPNSLVGQEFEMPPSGVLRYLMNGEIVSARGFEYDNLYVHFIMELANNWSSLPTQVHYGVTHTSRTKSIGKDNVAYFGYPFTFEAFYMSEKENSILQWPVLYFKVLSLDSWQRYRTEGYGYLLFPSTPGKHTLTCHTWRPLQTGTVSALRRFFIGGSPELEDHSYVRIPGNFKGERLSRFGFHTATSGCVTFNLHCIQQSRGWVNSTTFRKRHQNTFDQAQGFSHHESLLSTMEAFQRARRKMQEVRESLPMEFITSVSQMQI
ncbi:Meckel syndrome type 1 protein isoform X2 [Corythoichthys intestinalis]|uniref:Meckel syndrome type 1 protein isoform X2 n=1 Tax=Corythoichthys intestinalis TaxID=161448 RepID=UPI0025A5B871|nr:Meckel syndrome type 1 protein isoform X2 [Corythoichthys intestinalis]